MSHAIPLLVALLAAPPPPPDPGKPLADAALLMEVRGSLHAASHGFATVGREAPHSLNGHLGWARFLVREGRPDQAVGPAGAATRLDPYGAAPYATLGLAQLLAGQTVRGKAMLDKAFEMDPRSTDAWLALAQVFAAAGDVRREREALDRLAQQHGDDLRVRRAAALAALAAGDEAAGKAHLDALAGRVGGREGALWVGETWLMADRPDRALPILQQALAAWGPDPRVLRALGRAWLADGGAPMLGAAAFAAATRADPDDLDAAVGLGLALALAGDQPGGHDLAVRTLSGVLEKSPRHPGALLALATAAVALGDAAGAEGWLLKVPDHHPAKAEADSLLSLCKLSREDPYGAIRLLQAVLAQQPRLRHVRLNLALAYVRAGRSGDAQRAAAEAVDGLPPEHPLVKHAAAFLPAAGGGP